MAIVQLMSGNPKFSFLIRKAPAAGMQLREVRSGIAYGWYSGESTFNVYFRDADNEVSYKQDADEPFEYLNVSRYNTPLFPLAAINEFFSASFKARHEHDGDGYEHAFHIPMIHIERLHYIDIFGKHVPDCTIEVGHRAHRSYSLTVRTARSLHDLLHIVSVLCLFLSILGNEYMNIEDTMLDKYIRSLDVMDAPFYIRSLFARHFLTSRERFGKYRAALERTDRYAISLQYGGTAAQRRNFIAGALAFDKSIVDVGCGEGFYAIPFAGKIEGTYYAIDVDEELLERVGRKTAASGVGNVALFRSVDHFLESYNGETVDVIVTEVIEHMSVEEAAALLAQLFGRVEFARMIVTTPNAEFNRYYELEGFRHEDHKWEMGRESFRQWFGQVVRHVRESGRAARDIAFGYEFVDIGDRVDGVSTTQGVIVRRDKV